MDNDDGARVFAIFRAGKIGPYIPRLPRKLDHLRGQTRIVGRYNKWYCFCHYHILLSFNDVLSYNRKNETNPEGNRCFHGRPRRAFPGAVQSRGLGPPAIRHRSQPGTPLISHGRSPIPLYRSLREATAAKQWLRPAWPELLFLSASKCTAWTSILTLFLSLNPDSSLLSHWRIHAL